jgi:hypothetical protein
MRASAFACTGAVISLLSCASRAPKADKVHSQDSFQADSGTDSALPDAGDQDGDGFAAPEDCDDTNAEVYPGATERCDAVDQDCDGEADEDLIAWIDLDGDGWGTTPVSACTDTGQPTATTDGDCDDADPTIHPNAEEVYCDDIDQDCDGALPEMALVEGGPSYSSLQVAFDETLDGDVIELCDGTWAVEVDFSTAQARTVRSRSGLREQVILDGEGAHNLFHLSRSGELHLQDLTLQNAYGDSAAGPTIDHGGAISMTDATLVVERVDFFNNVGGDTHGGAIGACMLCEERSSGRVSITVLDARFEGNGADLGGGAISVSGGYFQPGTTSSVWVEGTTFAGNTAREGAADLYDDSYADSTSWTVLTSTFSGSSAGAVAGSIGVLAEKDADLRLEQSTFTDIQAAGSNATGAVLFATNGRLSATVSDTQFQRVVTLDAGAGMLTLAGDWATIALNNLSLEEASSGGSGMVRLTGGSELSVTASSLLLRDSTSTSPWRGALYISSGFSGWGDVSVSDLRLEGHHNSASDLYAALYLEGSAMKFEGSDLHFGVDGLANSPYDLGLEATSLSPSFVSGLGDLRALSCSDLASCVFVE